MRTTRGRKMTCGCGRMVGKVERANAPQRMGLLLGRSIRHQPVHSWVLQDAYCNRNSFGRITGHREPCASHAVVQHGYRYDLPFRPRSAQVTGLGRKIVLSDQYCFPFHIGWRGLASSLPLGLGSLRCLRSRSARLSTEPNLLRHLVPQLGVVGRHQGVVSGQPPLRAILFHRQSVAS